MDKSEPENSAMDKLEDALEAEDRAQKDYHIREAIQLLKLAQDD